MWKLVLAAVVVIGASTAFAAPKKPPARPAPVKNALDCAAYKKHFIELAYADFLAAEGMDLSAEERATSKAKFVSAMEDEPEIKAAVAECVRGEMPRSVYDCQMQAKTVDALARCVDD